MINYGSSINSTVCVFMFVLFAVLTLLLLYKLLEGLGMIGLDNYYDYNNKSPLGKRTKVMKCRRYRTVNGKRQVYYTEVDTGSFEYAGYYAGVDTPRLEALAPAGTKYLYLTCQRAWGYSEEEPKPECLLFGSKRMMDIAESIEVENNLLYK